jgi:hypothetical protein
MEGIMTEPTETEFLLLFLNDYVPMEIPCKYLGVFIFKEVMHKELYDIKCFNILKSNFSHINSGKC